METGQILEPSIQTGQSIYDFGVDAFPQFIKETFISEPKGLNFQNLMNLWDKESRFHYFNEIIAFPSTPIFEKKNWEPFSGLQHEEETGSLLLKTKWAFTDPPRIEFQIINQIVTERLLIRESQFNEIPSLKIESESNELEELIGTLYKNFEIKEPDALRKFFLKKSVLSVPKFTHEFDGLSKKLDEFFKEQNITYGGNIQVFHDHEISNLETISITIKIKNKTPSECVKLLHQLIINIVELNESILNDVQIQILPYQK